MAIEHPVISHKSTQQLFPTLLFFVFLLCTMFTVLIGSRVYENIRERNEAAFHTDTALAYITNKVRQNDFADALSVREVDSVQVLVLTSEYEGVPYETWIYQIDGYLWELFTKADSGLDLYSGQPIMDCVSVTFDIQHTNAQETLLTISLDACHDAKILLRTSQKGAFHS